MALDLTVTYPAQVATDVDYPQGKARNVTVAGDGTGTPWEEQIVNDWLGFFQGVLAAAGITPSGIPDTATTSDYVDALIYLIKNTTFTEGIRVEGANGLQLAALPTFTSAQTVVRVQALAAISGLNTDGNSIGGETGDARWVFDKDKLSLRQNNGVSYPAIVLIPLTNLVDNGSLISVTVMSSAPGYAALPAAISRPTYEIVYDDGTGVVSASPVVTDLVSSLATWQGRHSTTITLSTSVNSVDEAGSPKVFYLKVTGVLAAAFEAASSNGFQLHRILGTFSTTKLSPGG
jgi:hypothetical protein